MTTESVQIVIQGKDDITPTMHKIGEAMNETSNTTKKLSAVAGDLFSQLGAAGLAGVAGDMKQLSDMVGDSTDVMEKGRLGAIGMQAALVAMAVGVGWKVGTAIENWIFGTEKWRQKMKETMEEAAKTAEFHVNKSKEQHQYQMQINAAIIDENARREAQLGYVDKLDAKVKAAREELKAAQQEEETWRGGYLGEASWLGNWNKDMTDTLEKQTEIKKKHLENLEQQRKEANAINSEKQKELELAQKKFQQAQAAAALEKDIADQIRALKDPTVDLDREKALATTEDADAQKRIAALYDERKALQEKAEADKKHKDEFVAYQKEMAAEHERRVQKLIDDMAREAEERKRKQEEQIKKDDDYLAALEIRRVELAEGKDAADELKASFAGVSDAAIQEGKKLRDEIHALEAKKKADEETKKQAEKAKEEAAKEVAAPTATSLTAFEGRLLSRSASNPAADMAKRQEKMIELSEMGLTMLKAIVPHVGVIATNSIPIREVGS